MCSSQRPTASGRFTKSWQRGWPLTWRAMSRQLSGMSSRFVFRLIPTFQFIYSKMENCIFKWVIIETIVYASTALEKVNQSKTLRQNLVPPLFSCWSLWNSQILEQDWPCFDLSWFQFSWFFFELIVKSMAQHLVDSDKVKVSWHTLLWAPRVSHSWKLEHF